MWNFEFCLAAIGITLVIGLVALKLMEAASQARVGGRMSRKPYCPKCGVVNHIHSTIYCRRLEELISAEKHLLERVQTLSEELAETKAKLGEANAIIANTATVREEAK